MEAEKEILLLVIDMAVEGFHIYTERIKALARTWMDRYLKKDYNPTQSDLTVLRNLAQDSQDPKKNSALYPPSLASPRPSARIEDVVDAPTTKDTDGS